MKMLREYNMLEWTITLKFAMNTANMKITYPIYVKSAMYWLSIYESKVNIVTTYINAAWKNP